jgi:AraC family transcriptional regulator
MASKVIEPHGVRFCSASAWLKGLLDPRSQVKLHVCRYFNRKGVFGTGLRPLNEHMITFVEHGVLLSEVGRSEMRIPAGTAIWMPPGMLQRYCGAAGSSSVRQHNLRFQLLVNGKQLAFQRQALLVRNAWDVQPLLQMIGSLVESEDEFRPLRLRGLLLSLASTLLSNAEGARRNERILRPAQRQRLASYVALHAAEGILPSDLADEVQLTPDYFARIFRATYGHSPRIWLKAERMRLAAIRIRENDHSIKQVAFEFGFGNIGLFHRQFRQVLGCTPGEYRRRDLPLPERT